MARRGAVALLVIVASIGMGATGAQAQPLNDDLADALVVGGLPFSDTQDTVAATTETGEPDACEVAIGSTVWYSITPASDVAIVASTFDSDYDTVLSVFESTTESLVGCNDDHLSLQSRVRFRGTGGTTYLIQVGGFDGDTGSMTLDLTEAPPAPVNDDRADAEPIGALPFTTSLNTASASLEPGEAGCGEIGNTVWYRYTPALPGIVSADTFGSDYDTVLAAYVEIGGTLISIACNDDAVDLQSAITVPALPGITIYLQVGGYNGDAGEMILSVE